MSAAASTGRYGRILGLIGSTPVYPFAFACYFPLKLYTENTSLFALGDIWRPMLFLGAMTLIGFAVARYALRIPVHKAASSVFVILLILTLTGPFRQFFGPTLSGAIAYGAVLLGILLAGVLGEKTFRTTLVLNVVGLVVLTQPAAVFAQNLFLSPSTDLLDRRLERLAAPVRPEKQPSIIHIVLDGYSRADVLREVYGIDNQPFLDGLERMEFDVFDQAVSPYNQTLPTMTTVFSGHYPDLAGLGAITSNSGNIRNLLGRYIGDSSVIRLFRGFGFRILATSTGYKFLHLDKMDEVSQPAREIFALSLFELSLLQSSGLKIILDALEPLMPLDKSEKMPVGPAARQLNDAVRHAFETSFPEDPGTPYFLYQHIISPHPPFTIDRNGRDWDHYGGLFQSMTDGSEVVAGSDENRAAYISGYSEKIAYTNTALTQRLRYLIEKTAEPLIVVVHGDHGGGAYLEHNSASETCIRERFSPLLAVYVSDPNWRADIRAKLLKDPNLVNIYRAILGTVYGMDTPILESRAAFLRWDNLFDATPVAPDRLSQTCDAADG